MVSLGVIGGARRGFQGQHTETGMAALPRVGQLGTVSANGLEVIGISTG